MRPGTVAWPSPMWTNWAGQQTCVPAVHARPQSTAEVAAEVAAEFDVVAVAAVHRVGPLEVGDVAVVCAVSAAHRSEAFVATRALIDRLKERVPIWKHQRYEDGAEDWVEPGSC